MFVCVCKYVYISIYLFFYKQSEIFYPINVFKTILKLYYIYIYIHYCMYQSCKESAQYTCIAKYIYIYNCNSQIKLTQVNNY